MINKIINSEDPKYQSETISELVFDTTPTVNSFNTVTSDGIARAIAGASGEVPIVTEIDNGKVLTAVYDAGGAAVEWAEAQGGGSYTAGDGIAIDNDEISAVLGNSSGGMMFDNDGIAIDWDYMGNSSDGTLVALEDGNGATYGIKVANPLPDTTGASSGDVLTIGSSGPEWATLSGGGDVVYVELDTGMSSAEAQAAFETIKAAYDAGKCVIAYHDDNSTGMFTYHYFYRLEMLVYNTTMGEIKAVFTSVYCDVQAGTGSTSTFLMERYVIGALAAYNQYSVTFADSNGGTTQHGGSGT